MVIPEASFQAGAIEFGSVRGLDKLIITVISMGKDLSYVAQYLITRVLKQGYCFGVIEIPYINSAQTCSVTEMNLIHVDHKDMGTMKILV